MNLNLHLFNSALNFATQVHRNQKRKGKDIPYITHPLAVALLIARTGASEQTVIAGLLHDTIEDCVPYGSVTRQLLAERFGEDAARMVDDLTEQDKTLPWLERKQTALDHIKAMPHDSLLVKSADVLHNLSELIDDIARDGVKVLDKFNASREQTIEWYEKLIAEIVRCWPENPLAGELQKELDRLLRFV